VVIAKEKQCRQIHAFSFMSASRVKNDLNQIKVIVACFVHLVRSNVHQFNKAIVAVTKRITRLITALKDRNPKIPLLPEGKSVVGGCSQAIF
jgi:hypothetical protein